MRQKRKFTNKLLIFGIVFMLFGCSEDLYENENTFNSQGIKISKVSLKEPKFQNKTKLIQEVNKIKNKQTLASNSHRMVYDSINDFYFDDENGTLIENINGYESYTFKIVRETPIDSRLENVIFSKNQEGDFDTYLAKYPVSEEEIKTLSTEEFENMETNFQILNKAMEYICITTTIYGGCSETHSNGYTCSGESVTHDCYNMSGGGGGGSSGDGGGTGSGTGTSGQGGSVSTTPTGGGGGSNTTKNPCTTIKKLKNDFTFKAKLGVLKNATANNFEKYSVVYNDPTPNVHPGQEDAFDYVDSQGAANTSGAIYTGNADMQGVIHSHYQGLISIFSPGDLQDMYNQMVFPDITDDFFIGVVTAEGTAYILQVLDRQAFINFGNQYLSNDKKTKDFLERKYDKKYNIKTTNSKEINEKNFLTMMNELNMGVSLAGTTYNPTTPTSPSLFNNLPVKTIDDMTQGVKNTNCN
mgnify:CR=1 FL=1